MPTSIIEVARVAGVSTATVSRVLNEFPGVRDDTVFRVRAAVASLEYAPQRIRRGPKTGGARAARRRPRTGCIGVITVGQTHVWLQLPVMASVVAGISRAAADQGLRVIVDELPEASGPSQFFQSAQRGGIDGAVVFLDVNATPSFQQEALDLLRQRMAVVSVMGMKRASLDLDHVTYDNVRAGALAHEYLWAKGCREMAFVNAYAWPFMRLRGQAFLNAAFDAGAPATTYMLDSNPLHLEPFGNRVVPAPTLEELADRIAAAHPRPAGLFISCDRLTAEIYPLLIHRGLRPERDFTVISCDNEDIRLSALYPRPASIDIGADQVGALAVSRLLARIDDPSEAPVLIQVTPRLIAPADFGVNDRLTSSL